MTGRWAGRPVTKARAHWKARLPLPCYLCGGVVDGSRAWVVEHVIPRHLGGTDNVSNQWVSHRTCSDRSGGQHGARLTNARRETDSTSRIEKEPLRW